MALQQFDLIIGGQKGNKLMTGTITTVNDDYTITTGLAAITAANFNVVGTNTVTCSIASISGGNIIVSLTSPQVNTVTCILSFVAVAGVNTVLANITGH